MGVFDAATWAIKGHSDVFDRAISAIEDIEGMLPPVEYHSTVDRTGGGPGHFYDPAEEEWRRLNYAIGLVRYACQIAQEVLGGIE